MEHGPWYLPISHKMHLQPRISIRNFNYTQTWVQVMGNGHTDGAYLNWRSPIRLMPGCQPPIFVGAPREKYDKRKVDLLINLALVVSMKTALAPFERVQLLMQNQNAMIQSGRLSHPYKGIFNCFARTISNEGVISLWRGNTARVIGQCSSKVMSFACISYAKSRAGHWDYGGVLALSGLLAASLFVQYSLMYAGIRLANDIKTTRKVGKWQFNGIVDVCRKTLKSDGIVGLYRGYQIALIGNGMTSIVHNQLSLALKTKELLQLLGIQNNLLARSTVGLGIAACTMVATYPMDTVNKRMMMTSGEALKYRNTLDAFSQIYKKEGIMSFYKGGGADMLRLCASNGFLLFMFYLLGFPLKGKDNRSRDGGQPTSPFTIRWVNGNRENV
ncbi:hypothetical protein REPUB_Repub13aG0243200 [Reevesia pubescens]